MAKRMCALIACGIIALLAGATPTTQAKPETTDVQETKLPEHMLLCYKERTEAGNAAVLTKVKTRKLGGRAFLVGQIAFIGNSTEFEETELWVPVDGIIRMIGFTSLDQAIKASKKNDEKTRDELKEEKVDTPKSKVLWRTGYNKAREVATKKKLPLILVFGTDNCLWCKKLHRAINEDDALAGLLNEKTIPVKLDGKKYDNLAAALRIESYPTTLITRPDGKILASIEGFLEPKKFRELIEKALKWREEN
jgi:thioredoxin-related protein